VKPAGSPSLKALLRRLPIFRVYRAATQRRAYRTWLANGRPVPPPPILKQRVVREYAARYRVPIFIETGTFLGDMVAAVRGCFERVYSIELSSELWADASRRFRGATNVTIVQGDSGEVLAELLRGITQPCLFWLDGHYSAGETAKGTLETPIVKELAHIRNHPLILRHVILIDDARCFTGVGDYPTLDSVRQVMHTAGLGCFEVRDDIVRMVTAR
jgi:hypothetical protein